MITTDSAHDFGETIQRLTSAIDARGLQLLACFDHAGGAREFGLQLADESVLVFGHPRTGTPLMRADPRVGIALPLRLLVWADTDRVRVGYDDPREWVHDYSVTEQRQTLEAMASLLEALAGEVAAGPAPRAG
jgi:uncharacterized protein (DUF302 family)